MSRDQLELTILNGSDLVIQNEFEAIELDLIVQSNLTVELSQGISGVGFTGSVVT